MNHAILNGLSNSIGETHYGAKLTEEQVIQIRELYATKKYTQRQLGKMYGVCFQHISKIVNNKQWKHI
jgi:DNA-binding XRE family transcriptional regulator